MVVGDLGSEVEANLRRSAEALSDTDEIARLEARLTIHRERNNRRMTTASLRYRGEAISNHGVVHDLQEKRPDPRLAGS